MRNGRRTKQKTAADIRNPRNVPAVMIFSAVLTWTGAVVGTVGIWLTAGLVFPAVAHWQEHLARAIEVSLRP